MRRINCSPKTPNPKGTLMSRGKAINVKIATSKVIKALEDKLAQIKKQYAEQDALEAKYQKALEKWNKDLLEFALANIKKAKNLRTNLSSWNNKLNIDFDIPTDGDYPKQPQRDFEQLHAHTYNEMVEEIENAIRILKMTDEEVVSTSTYNAIARYL
jgi:hypothetical protein